jgi:hypothetical protein
MRALPVFHDPESAASAPGEGARARTRTADTASTDGVKFRDPPPAAEAARPLELAIARALVGARALPTELPIFRISLLGVKVDKHGIDLVLGPSEPVAHLRLTRPKDEESVRVDVVEIHPEARKWARALTVLAERVRVATTPAKWDAAWSIATEMRKLPADVPLGFFRQLVAGVEPKQGLVRVGFRCNQDCGMCWQGREWGRYGADQVVRWIEDLRAAGAGALILSGGEPTLDPELVDYLRRARELGFTSVTLETNAVQMAKAGYAERLFEAGLTTAFVSLHSGDAEVSDAITRAPGTHARTVKGTQALLEAGIQVVLNAVMTAEGIDHLGALPDFIHTAFGRHPLLASLMISYPTEPFERSLMAAIAPEPARLRTAPGPVDFRVHPEPCSRCAVKPACFGVRVAEFERFGDACVMPIENGSG